MEKKAKRKYVLKPGNHQFIPKGHGHFSNKNTTDNECKWYLDKFPHIQNLFIVIDGQRVKKNK